MQTIRHGFQLNLVSFAFLLLALVVFGSAAAQNTVTGTVDAVVNGEARTWYTMLLEAESTGQPTATWSDDMFTNFSIQAHPEKRFSVEGALSIEFMTFKFPEACPCTFPDATVTIWATSSMFNNFYEDSYATLTLTSIEPLGNDVFAIEGSFSANLVFWASLGSEPDPNNTLEVEGTFAIEHMPRESLED